MSGRSRRERFAWRLRRVARAANRAYAPLRVEAERALEALRLLRAERRAVALGRILLGGRAEADVRGGDDEDRLARRPERAPVGAVDRLEIVPVARVDLPAVALEALLRVVRHRQRRVALDRDAVGVVDEDEVVELHRARPAARLVRNALLQVAVAAEDPRLVAGLRLLRAERQAHAHGDALAERTRRHLDAGEEPALGMPRAAAAVLAERLELVHRQPRDAREVEQRVDQRARVPARKDETVAARPLDVLRRHVEVVEPERNGEVGHAQRGARMTRIGLVDHVRAQTADRVRREFKLFDGEFHSLYSIPLSPRRVYGLCAHAPSRRRSSAAACASAACLVVPDPWAVPIPSTDTSTKNTGLSEVPVVLTSR